MFSLRERSGEQAQSQGQHEGGNLPPVNSAAMDTPVTEPIVISTMEGGMVSLIAPEADSRDIISP